MQTCTTSHILIQLAYSHPHPASLQVSHINQHTAYRHPGRIAPKSFLFGWVVAGVTGAGNEYPLYAPVAYTVGTLADRKRVQ